LAKTERPVEYPRLNTGGKGRFRAAVSMRRTAAQNAARNGTPTGIPDQLSLITISRFLLFLIFPLFTFFPSKSKLIDFAGRYLG